MKKVFIVLTLVKVGNWTKNRIFNEPRLFTTKKEAEKHIKEEEEFDAKFIENDKYSYFIMEGLIITQEKIKSIIDNSNVE